MSDQASVQTIVPGLHIKQAAIVKGESRGASETSGPFARHLSDASAPPVEQDAAPSADGGRSVGRGADPVADGKSEAMPEAVPDTEQVRAFPGLSSTTSDGTTDVSGAAPSVMDVPYSTAPTMLHGGNAAQGIPQSGGSYDEANVTVTPEHSASGVQTVDSAEVVSNRMDSAEKVSAFPGPMLEPGKPAVRESEVSVDKTGDTSSGSLEPPGRDRAGTLGLPANHSAAGIDRARQADAHLVDGSGKTTATSNVQLPQSPVANVVAPLEVAPPATPATTAVQASISVRGVGGHPLLAREMSQRTAGSADVTLARLAADRSGSADGAAGVAATDRILVPAVVDVTAEEQPALSQGLTLAEARVKVPVSALQTPVIATSMLDGQAAGATSATDAEAINLPANMFHAVGSGTLTAALGSRMDAGAAAQLAPHVVHLQMGHGDGSLSENVRWVVDNNLRNVTVNVTPSGMGPVSINVVMESEQMNVSIVANQGATREALEAALPRLREQLVQQGNEQVKVDVSDGRSSQANHGEQQKPSRDEQSLPERTDLGSSAEPVDDDSNSTGRSLMCGLVDAYA